MKLHEVTWPEVTRLDRDKTLVIAPIAACEQHSRHLPTFTDAILCGAVADGVEANLPDRVLQLPTQWMGASAHHFNFGATLSLPVDMHISMLEELLKPLLDDGFKRCMLLNGHGGNVDTLHVALRSLHRTYNGCQLTGASYWQIASQEIAKIAQADLKDMGHACEFETSMIMHLRPDLVRTDQIKDDHQESPNVLRGLFVARDIAQRSESGAVGYPEAATPETGKKALGAIIARVTEVSEHLLEEPLVPPRGRVQP